jgi:hypothetical protein
MLGRSEPLLCSSINISVENLPLPHPVAEVKVKWESEKHMSVDSYSDKSNQEWM